VTDGKWRDTGEPWLLKRGRRAYWCLCRLYPGRRKKEGRHQLPLPAEEVIGKTEKLMAVLQIAGKKPQKSKYGKTETKGSRDEEHIDGDQKPAEKRTEGNHRNTKKN